MVQKLCALIPALADVRAVVVGDVMLDEYVWGRVDRISPEAPVPVVWVERRTYLPGGAANVARNVAALGARAYAVGAVGDDVEGSLLRDALARTGADVGGLVVAANRPTITKSRVIAQGQQLCRIDREDSLPPPADVLDQLAAVAANAVADADVVVLSDYQKGTLAPAFVAAVLEAATRSGCLVAAGPKPANIEHVRGVRALSLNRYEAQVCTGGPATTPEQAARAARTLLDRTGSDAVFLTLGEDGLCVGEREGPVHHVPVVPCEVADRTGAGDTVLALLSLALAAGATPVQAGALANLGGSVVVRHVGCATATRDDLLAAARENGHHLADIRLLPA
jgi:D-beta-D-heptose 7-phosphate kinase/D-beta-D-heptose 1-phosphate adenosyltransferase